MTKSKYYLCIDQGGHASRAFVIDENAETVASAFSEIDTLVSDDGLVVEHDPEQLICSIFSVIDAVLTQLGDKAALIVSAGLATQRSSMICWNRHNGEVLSSVISWQDRRALNDLSLFEPLRESIREKTGLYLNAHYGASKMRWCLENLRSVKLAEQHDELAMGPLASYILFRLLAERPFLVDPCNASRTLLMNIEQQDWDEELCRVFGVDSAALPVIRSNHFHFGSIEMGGYSIPLMLCTGDQSAALFAQGRLEPDICYINAGSGVFLQRPVVGDISQCDPELLSSVVLNTGWQTVFVVEGTVNGGARALSWFEDQYAVSDLHQKLEQWLADVAPKGFFINGISGVGSPFWLAQLQSRFVDVADDAQRAVAVVESIVFLCMENIRRMGEFRCIRLSGGLSNMNAYCQNLADLSGYPVFRQAEQEATVMGVYRLLNGSWEQEIPVADVQIFEPGVNDELVRRYGLWRTEMKLLSGR